MPKGAPSGLVIRHHANVVFPDRQPRTLGDLRPASQCEMLGKLTDYARLADAPGPRRT